MKNTLLLLFVLVFNTSCPIFIKDNQNDDLNEPKYIQNIAWKTEVDCCTNWSYPFEEGGYGYYPEDVTRSGIDYCRLVKINLNNGDIIWRTGDVQCDYTDQAQKIGGYIYVPLNEKDIFMVYDDDNGFLAATVSLKSEPKIGLRIGPFIHTVKWNNYIFWGNQDASKEYHGLMRFDTSLINFTNEPEVVQLIEPELVWKSNEQNSIHTNIIVNDEKVYFLTTRHWFTGGTVKKSYLVSLEAGTGKVLWTTEREFGRGERENSLLINEDRLYVIDMNPSCYDIHTGEPIFEKKDDEYTGAGSMLKGIFWYNNILYYTTGMHSRTVIIEPTADPKRVKNIICIDGDTGNLVWGDLVPNGRSIYTFPLVNNGKAYVVTDKGLRVYDAYTGALIGVDRKIDNLGDNHCLLYNNMVIYVNIESRNPLSLVLTAIRAD
jgi:hypothetical protein